MGSPLDTTIGDQRAHALRAEYHAIFGPTGELPVPVKAIAEDLLGLRIVTEPLDVAGLLYPGERLGVSGQALAGRLYNLGLVADKPA